MNWVTAIFDFALPKMRSVFRFFTMQGITLIGNLLYGLFCVRFLAPVDYAKFVVVFGVQGMLMILMDANMSGTLIPLIGERAHDLPFIADYIASLRKMARITYAIVGVGLIACYPILVSHRGWSRTLIAAMIITLLVASWFARMASIYGAVLILLRDRTSLYRGQMISSLGTLTLLGIAWGTHRLVAFVAILINVLGMVFCATYYYVHARRLLGVSGTASSSKIRAMVKLGLPNIPQAIFYAFQGQISLFLITFFGRANGIASVGALARLGQIFALILQMNPMLIEPYFAKLPKARIKSSYFSLLAIVAGVCLAIILLSAAFPEIFLWVLGPAYRVLRHEVLLAMIAGGISCFSGALWCVHSARRFIYWWSSLLGIGLTLILQVVFIAKADLTAVRTVLWLNISMNLTSLLVNAVTGIWGFAKGSKVEDPSITYNEDAAEAAQLANLDSAAPAIIAATLLPSTHPE